MARQREPSTRRVEILDSTEVDEWAGEDAAWTQEPSHPGEHEPFPTTTRLVLWLLLLSASLAAVLFVSFALYVLLS
jgi:hypothetical protein